MPRVSYAQNFEDVILSRAFPTIRDGFYLDIGAYHPVIDSVSLMFYEQGWRGIHVEPVPEMVEAFRRERSDETVIQAAVSSTPGEIVFYESSETGLSTGVEINAEKAKALGRDVKQTSVSTLPLSDLFDQCPSDIHWMKVDVEGMEQDVLESWGDSAARPWIVMVESTLPNSQTQNYGTWEHELTSRDYSFVYFDGLNRFYVHKHHAELATHFQAGPNVFDDFVLSEVSSFAAAIAKKKHDISEELQSTSEKHAHAAAELSRVLKLHEDLASAHRSLVDTHGIVTQDLNTVRSALDSAEADKASLNADKASLNADKASLNEALSSLEQTRLAVEADLKAQLRANSERVAALQAENHYQVQANQNLAADIHRLQQSLSEIYASSSWKFSSPVRAGGRLGRKLKAQTLAVFRPVVEWGLRFIRTRPAVKAVTIKALSIAPPLRAKALHFASVRPAIGAEYDRPMALDDLSLSAAPVEFAVWRERFGPAERSAAE